MPIVVINNTKPNITHLPWTSKKSQGIQSFYPGNNRVDQKIMEAVVVQAGEDAWRNYYSKFLKPVGGAVDSSAEIDLSELSAAEFIDLVEGEMNLEELDKYGLFEKANSNRKTVLRAIDDQVEKITAIDAKKSGDQ